jgi:hypothetical protein
VPLLVLRRHPEQSEGSLYFALAVGFGFGFENKVELPVLFTACEKVSVLSPRLPHTSPRFHHKSTTLYHPIFPKSPLFTGISLFTTTPRKTAAILPEKRPQDNVEIPAS